jgi:hypothetical protein
MPTTARNVTLLSKQRPVALPVLMGVTAAVLLARPVLPSVKRAADRRRTIALSVLLELIRSTDHAYKRIVVELAKVQALLLITISTSVTVSTLVALPSGSVQELSSQVVGRNVLPVKYPISPLHLQSTKLNALVACLVTSSLRESALRVAPQAPSYLLQTTLLALVRTSMS